MIQAEDGIRDIGVTGVQTCAFPISCSREEKRETPMIRLRTPARSEARLAIRARVGPILPATPRKIRSPSSRRIASTAPVEGSLNNRSEERRVGKECRSRWGLYDSSRRRHTRYWRDWSSDVCFSDLVLAGRKARDADDSPAHAGQVRSAFGHPRQGWPHFTGDTKEDKVSLKPAHRLNRTGGRFTQQQIGRASCRERV